MFDIVTAPKPAVTRVTQGEPNPFDGKFPTPEGEALSVVQSAATADEVKKLVEKVQRLARLAANAATSEENPDGFTARSLVTTETTGAGKAAKVTATILLWSTKREKRPGSGAKAAAAAPTEAPAAS